jgi:hypothetical protein
MSSSGPWWRRRELQLLSEEHFTVDRTLIEAWASLKRFRRKDAEPHEPPDDSGNPVVNFRGERRANATHQSATDPEARLAKKGADKEARLCYSANALMENRNTFLIDFRVEPADGYAERRAAIVMLDENLAAGGLRWPATVATTPTASSRFAAHSGHTACGSESGAPGRLGDYGRTVRHRGYAISQWIR